MSWKKYRKFLSIALFLLFLGGVYFFVNQEMIPGIEVGRKNFQEAMAIQERQHEEVANIQRFKDDFDLVEKAEGKIPSFLNGENGVEFIQEVEKLSEGKNSRIAIEVAPAEESFRGKSAAKEKTEGIMSSLPVKDYIQFKIKTVGSFLGLVKFINQLENSKYYLDIVSLQINVNQEAGIIKKNEVPEKINPFSSADNPEASSEERVPENKEEVIGLINVVVYIQSQ